MVGFVVEIGKVGSNQGKWKWNIHSPYLPHPWAMLSLNSPNLECFGMILELALGPVEVS